MGCRFRWLHRPRGDGPIGAAGSGDTGHPADAQARADRAFVARSARVAIVAGVATATTLALLWLLKAALTPLAAAFVIAYLLDPVVDRFEARRVRRSVAILLLVGVLGGGLAGFLLVLLPRLQRELVQLAERLPGYLEQLTTVALPAIEQRLGVELPRSATQLVDGVRAGEIPLPLETLRELVTGLLASLTGTVSALVGLLVVPILAYYLLVEFDPLLQRMLATVPPRYRGAVAEKARTVDRLISGFLRGQLLVALILGVLYAVGFSLIGIDLAVGIGLLAGALALVPYLGNAVALALASGLCVLEFGFDGHLIAVVIWYALVQNLEGFVLTPRIVGRSVGLHPALVIVALLIGGDLFGFLGLLLAVPLAAVVKVFVDELVRTYRSSSIFTAGASDLEEPDGA